SFLLAKRKDVQAIAARLHQLDPAVLAQLSTRLEDGEKVKPGTPAEKACFAVLDDLDFIGGKVQGSLTSKKYLRNEVWSVIAFKGAPSWFITFSPVDVKHPLCLYYADKQIKF